jgi:hypothetical protein
MALAGIAAIGVVVGIIAHLLLGKDGYSWFGEIMLACVGAVTFGLVTGIFVGMREIKPEVMIAALIGAVLVDAVVVWLTIRATGRGLGRAT